jgi:hypothetical protein
MQMQMQVQTQDERAPGTHKVLESRLGRLSESLQILEYIMRETVNHSDADIEVVVMLRDQHGSDRHIDTDGEHSSWSVVLVARRNDKVGWVRWMRSLTEYEFSPREEEPVEMMLGE